MTFGTTPLSTTTLGVNQFPVSAVQEPGQTNLTAVEGGPGSVDSNSNRTAPMTVYVKDGGDVTLGTSTDANTVASVMGRLTKIRDLLNTTLAVTQSGTWNITNISGTVSLPTGASTSAKQPALGTAGTASSDVLTVQGIASMTALKVDGSAVTQPVSGTFWQATQPISAASLPLPSGASTSAKQPVLGTAGSSSSDVLTVQGITSMTALKVDGSGVTQPVSGTFWQATQPVSGTVAATQSGTWTVQPGNTANTTAWKVDNSAVTQPVSGTFWQATQPVSGTVTANAGTNLNTSALALDTSVNGILLSQGSTTSGQKGALIQGAVTTNAPSYTTAQSSPLSLDASGLLRISLKDTPVNTTALKVDGSGVTQPVSGTVSITANSSVNVAQVAGTTTDTNSGNKSAGTMRVVLATDQPALTNKLLVTPDSVALPANQSVNISQINAVTPLMGNGATGTGSQRVTIASDNTAFSVNAVESGTWTVQPGNTQNTTAWLTSQSATQSVSVTMQSAVAANANGTTLNVLGMATAAFTVSGTFSATVNFEGTEDNSNWVAIEATPFNSTTPATTTTTTGSFIASCAGMQSVRARVSGYASGNVTVTAHAVPVGGSSGGGGGGGGSGGTSLADDAAFTVGTTSFTPVGGLYNDSAAAATSGHADVARLSQNRGLHVNLRTNAGVELTNTSNALDVNLKSGAIPTGTNTIGSVKVTDGTNTANVLAATSVSNAIGSQAAQLIAGAYQEQASLSAGSLNADLVASTDVSNYKWFSLQINTNAYSGTLTFQCSNDNSNWISLNLQRLDNPNAAPAATTTGTNQLWVGPIQFRYLRVRMTSYNSGTAQGTLELYAETPSPTLGLPLQIAQATAYGNFNVAVASISSNAGVTIGNVGHLSADTTVLASAARTTTQTQSDQTNTGRGLKVVLDVTSAGTGSLTLEIDGKDTVSGKYYAILTGAAVTGNSTNVYTVYPGLTAVANTTVSDVLPHTYRVLVTANNANSVTYSVGMSTLP